MIRRRGCLCFGVISLVRKANVNFGELDSWALGTMWQRRWRQVNEWERCMDGRGERQRRTQGGKKRQGGGRRQGGER
jgi:hypothetical protein